MCSVLSVEQTGVRPEFKCNLMEDRIKFEQINGARPNGSQVIGSKIQFEEMCQTFFFHSDQSQRFINQ